MSEKKKRLMFFMSPVPGRHDVREKVHRLDAHRTMDLPVKKLVCMKDFKSHTKVNSHTLHLP